MTRSARGSYSSDWPQALGDLRRQNGASPSVLKPDLLKKLEDRLREPPEDGGRWTSAKVAAWMAAELGLARLAPQRGWEALKALGWSVQTPRRRLRSDLAGSAVRGYDVPPHRQPRSLFEAHFGEWLGGRATIRPPDMHRVLFTRGYRLSSCVGLVRAPASRHSHANQV